MEKSIVFLIFYLIKYSKQFNIDGKKGCSCVDHKLAGLLLLNKRPAISVGVRKEIIIATMLMLIKAASVKHGKNISLNRNSNTSNIAAAYTIVCCSITILTDSKVGLNRFSLQ